MFAVLVCLCVCKSVCASVCLCLCIGLCMVRAIEHHAICLLVCLWMGGDCLGGFDACQILNHACLCSVVCISTVCIRS